MRTFDYHEMIFSSPSFFPIPGFSFTSNKSAIKLGPCLYTQALRKISYRCRGAKKNSFCDFTIITHALTQSVFGYGPPWLPVAVLAAILKSFSLLSHETLLDLGFYIDTGIHDVHPLLSCMRFTFAPLSPSNLACTPFLFCPANSY